MISLRLFKFIMIIIVVILLLYGFSSKKRCSRWGYSCGEKVKCCSGMKCVNNKCVGGLLTSHYNKDLNMVA